MSFLEIFAKIKIVINIVGGNLDNLVQKIDSVRFNNENILVQFLKMFKYIVGDSAWLMICGMLSIGLMLMLYRGLLIVLTVIKEIIPGIKGKIAIR